MYVIVAGAGLIGRQITEMLVKNKHDVVVVDQDEEVCESIYAETGALTINGNATDIRVLEKAGGGKADVILCLMHQASDNVACALLAKSLGVARIMVRCRNPRYEEAYRLAGVTTIIKTSDLVLNTLMMEVEQPKIIRVITLGGGAADIYAIKIPADAKSVGMRIKEITENRRFPQECVFTGIYRKDGGDFLIPRGNSTLQEGDTVFLVAKSQHINKAADFLSRIR